MSENFLLRTRKLTPQNLFLSVLHLATSTNEDGMNQALQRTWQVQKLKMEHTPVKSSLSEAREKVSYEFFRDIFKENFKLKTKYRKTFRGFHIYAVDGDDLNLPASKDVLEKGYRGAPLENNFETHYPKMYTVCSYDVLNGSIRDFEFSNKYQEFPAAVSIVKNAEQNSITIYDRLYCGYPLLAAHIQEQNHCIIRVRINGLTTHKPVKKFLESGRSEQIVAWYPHKKEGRDGIKVRLVKFTNPKTKKEMVFATTLSKEQFSRKDIQKLYLKRWAIETTFRDLTQTLKMGQWHSRKVNGILQEIFSLLWFVNNVKMQMARFSRNVDLLEQGEYDKSNFKLCAKLIIENIDMVLEQKFRRLSNLLKFWIKRTQERRRPYSRSYPRVVKRKLSKFPLHSKVPRRC